MNVDKVTFFNSIEYGNLEYVKYCVKNHEHYTKKMLFYNNHNPLEWAVIHGRLDIVKYMIKKYKFDLSDIHCLELASMYGRVEILKYLLDEFEIFINDNIIMNIFCIACSENRLNIIEYMVNNYIFDKDSQYILLRAASFADNNIYNFLNKSWL
jgi:ankyrin repeat protein